jgi:hypothetical protein
LLLPPGVYNMNQALVDLTNTVYPLTRW